jgi:mannose-6-phosphate isomerase-like protein (cupin superfamily)
MADSYSKTNFGDVADMYAQYGMQAHGEARYLREDVGAETIGVSLYELRPGKRTGFAHRHKTVEELYIVLAGSGRVKINDELIELARRDVVRVSPEAVREFEAGPNGLELLATGGHASGDGETIENWWT